MRLVFLMHSAAKLASWAYFFHILRKRLPVFDVTRMSIHLIFSVKRTRTFERESLHVSIDCCHYKKSTKGFHFAS